MSKTFSKITEQENTLLVVDSLNLAFRYKHSGATDFAEDYLRTVQSLKKSYKASHVIIAGDMGSSSYRKAIYPEYKQNRKDKFAEQTDAEKAAASATAASHCAAAICVNPREPMSTSNTRAHISG